MIGIVFLYLNKISKIHFFLLFFFSLLRVVDDFEERLSEGSYPENLVKAVDSKFRKSAQEVHIRYSKVGTKYKVQGIIGILSVTG